MRRAFVLQLGPATQPATKQFEGCIEEVDTGRELRFHSTEELLAFLAECFEKAGPGSRDPPAARKEVR